MPGDRVFANRATSWFVSLRSGVHIPDSQNGYRLIKTSLYKSLKIKAKRYAAESEVLIRAAKAGREDRLGTRGDDLRHRAEQRPSRSSTRFGF